MRTFDVHRFGRYNAATLVEGVFSGFTSDGYELRSDVTAYLGEGRHAGVFSAPNLSLLRDLIVPLLAPTDDDRFCSVGTTVRGIELREQLSGNDLGALVVECTRPAALCTWEYDARSGLVRWTSRA